jgi:hypothetical protein
VCGADTCSGVPINPAKRGIQCARCAKWIEVGPDGYILPPKQSDAMAERHQKAAIPLHIIIVGIFGFLALACIGGGIYAIAANAKSKTDLDIFGVHLSTGHVGVAFVGIGLIIALLSVRAVLKNQHALATLTPDYPVRRRKKK